MIAARAAAAAVTVLLLFGVGAASRVRHTAPGSATVVVRLSWRARGEEIERCRRATAAELAGVPAHMRQEVVCEEQRVAPYRLRVAIDGRVVSDSLAPGSGMTGDRPMYVFRDFGVGAGTHRLEVLHEKQGDDSDTARDGDAGAERNRRRQALPTRLSIDTAFTLRAGDILLVTYNADLRRLTTHTPSSR